MPDSSVQNPNATYDLAVIGAGSAGFSAAITAADDGARVALIGFGTIGGTCVNVGCVPSKAMIRAMDTMHIKAVAARFDGVEASAAVTDWQAVVQQKQALVDDLRAAKYTDVLPNYQSVAYLEGKAVFDEKGGLQMNGKTIDADKVIIATGSKPHVPEIEGIESVTHYDSTSILELETLPKSLLVMGGGYIGVELAQMFARAGTKVTIVTRRRLLPEGEPEISAALTEYFELEGVRVLDGLSYENVAEADGQVNLQVTGSNGAEVLSAEKLLLATGRVPNVESLELANAGIKVSAQGGVVVDNRMRTSRDGVYAAGDVTGEDQFVYMAAYGAKIAAKNAMNSNSLSYDNAVVPAVVFCDPQVASVGLTEAQAKAAGFDAQTSVLGLENVPRALAARDTRGLIKLVADRATKKLLGAHILAPEGSDSIQTAAMAIRAGMSYEQLGEMIFPYLTTVEGLKLAAQTFDKDVSKLSCCAG